ncbi:BTB/POZ domain-containing protein SR1IP1 [Linum perenne]
MVEELANMSQKKDLLSSAMKRTSEWIISQEISSDVTVYVGGASFSLHKFLLVSKSGYMRKLVSNADVSEVRIPEIPGGVDAFELAAKFCYGINFEIGTENIAVLRCVAEYLEMTEEYAVGNLVSRTEAYLNEVTLKSLTGAVSVLQSTESLGPIAEKVKLVNRCIDSIALITCKESSQFSMPGRSDGAIEGLLSPTVLQPKPPVVDWWAEDLTVLRIDMFQRVLIAMVSRGFKQYALGPILMLYAKKSLRGLEAFSKGRKKIEPQREHEKRVVLETIVSLLPKEKNALSVSFLSMLLRAAIYLESTVACRLDLEKRMASQLGQAVLDDLLIPAYSFTGDTLFDVDTVKRIMINYIEYEVEGKDRLGYHGADDINDMERVGKLMENYLAEIASDRNLAVSKFISLAELVPEQSRIVDDEMYRAIDIYLKAHPALSDLERKKVCSVMDCQKLSREACAHAAQNDRLPVQTVVQVLYYEQQRLRDSMNVDHPTTPTNKAPYSVDVHPVPDELSILKRENQDLKFELLKMKMKLRELEKFSSASSSTARSTGDSPMGISNSSPSAADKPPLPPKKPSFINSVSKKLGKLSPFVGVLPSKPRKKPPKDRRHSIS